MNILKTLPDGIQIVEFDESLAPALADMWNQSRDSWGGDRDVKTPEQVLSKQSGGAFFNVYVAMKGNEAVGYCSLDRYPKDENTACVHLLNVRPDYHGKGIGKELVLMCVRETISRGMPQVELRTWPGNIKAIPMYKKCGFLWDSGSDDTHLSNYIPTVLSTELFEDFFARADWYENSSRKIDINPDSVKVNGFEFYGYEWEHDNKRLKVGFEKTGRKIRYIETDDYKIEMNAEEHELAFGLTYKCSFNIVNKSGKELDIKIRGKDDGVIKFNGKWDAKVGKSVDGQSGERPEGEFYVGFIKVEQDSARRHPCVLAELVVNGSKVEMGLGIKPRFPVSLRLDTKSQIAQPGSRENIYLSIENALPQNAELRFGIPKNRLLGFGESEHVVKLEKGKNKMLGLSVKVLECGYLNLPITCEIELEGGQRVNFTQALHVINQGVSGQFAFETEKAYGAANGLWRLCMSRENNSVKVDRIIPAGYAMFEIPSIGKPYSDEFNLSTPEDVRFSSIGSNIRFEADFVSKIYEDVTLTVIFELSASGLLNYRHKLTNLSANSHNLYMKAELRTNIGGRLTLPYNGEVHELKDDLSYGFNGINPDNIDGNWMFDNDEANPTGLIWPSGLKADAYWGDRLRFEHVIGKLAPGAVYKTENTVYMCGIFRNFKEFYSHVTGMYSEPAPITRNHLEIVANNHNPVLSGSGFEIKFQINRMLTYGGEIALSSPDRLFAPQSKTLDPNESQDLCFELEMDPKVAALALATIDIYSTSFAQSIKRALFIPNEKARVSAEESDRVLTVTNGPISFSSSLDYSDALYSLKFKEFEWLHSLYPNHEPYSWWNPYIGGIQTLIHPMQNTAVLREERNAMFVYETDVFGNRWFGIQTDVEISKHRDYKGISYSQYFLTLPGVPIVAHFAKIYNNSGSFHELELHTEAAISGKEELKNIYVSFAAEDNREYHLRMGDSENDMDFDRFIAVSRGGENRRSEKMYIFKDAKRDGGVNAFDFNVDYASGFTTAKINVEDGSSYVTRPMFVVLTDTTLSLEALTDLERLYFV